MSPSSRSAIGCRSCAFLSLGLGGRAPDAKTLWLFREQLVRAGAIEALFARFDNALQGAGYLTMGGQIIDATGVAASRQKLSDDEKAVVKAGARHRGWSKAKRGRRISTRDGP